MTEEKQNIAIAEFYGWTEISQRCMWGLPPGAIDCGTESCLQHFPKYTRDLNAIHESKQHLSEEQRKKWGETAVEMTNNFPRQFIVLYCKNPLSGEGVFNIANMTAAQESECLLKTIGKWEGQ
jgi:hypothetical protein